MSENENETIDSTNDNEALEVEITDDAEESEETITIPKSKWTEALAKQEHWKKKATSAKPEAKPETKQTQTEQALSLKDSFALAKAGVEEDDIQDIADYATLKKVSISEALKSNYVKSLLAEKEEFRKSQEASTTPNVKRATPKVTDDVILDNARKGKLGESEDEIRALFRARMKK